MLTQTVIVSDATLGSPVRIELAIELPVEDTTVRDLIRGRVYQFTHDQQQKQKQTSASAFTRSATEQLLNGAPSRTPPQLNWKDEFDKACRAFDARQFLILVDGKEVQSLEQRIEVAATTEIKFLRITPLAGG